MEDQSVLSEVHMDTCPPNASAWCTRFCYSLPEESASKCNAAHQHQSRVDLCLATTFTAREHQDIPAAAPRAVNSNHTPNHNIVNGMHEPGMSLDGDGDLALPRRPRRRNQYIVINHSLATPVSRCGEQVWLGACLLCDWVLHNRQRLAGQTVMELGAGVGLVSILAAQHAGHVFLTDGDKEALRLASNNVAANAKHQQLEQPCSISSRQSPLGSVAVRQLDWLQLFDTQLARLTEGELLQLLNSSSVGGMRASCVAAGALESKSPKTSYCREQQEQQQHSSSHAWSRADLACLGRAHVWLAADVVYNETITDAFMHAAHQLMCWQHIQQHHCHGTAAGGVAAAGNDAAGNDAAGSACCCDLPRLYIAVEKRYNFTLRDMDARASAFDHFLTYLQQQPGDRRQLQQRQGHQVHQQRQRQQPPLFHGRRLDVDGLPQVMVYDRSPDLELWELVPLLQ